jgi:hypothetical protein
VVYQLIYVFLKNQAFFACAKIGAAIVLLNYAFTFEEIVATLGPVGMRQRSWIVKRHPLLIFNFSTEDLHCRTQYWQIRVWKLPFSAA